MRRGLLLLPLAIFLLMLVFLFKGLFLDNEDLPSALIGSPFPAFSLPSVEEGEGMITAADLKGRPALVNVWGTWCVACRVEHPVLNQLAEQGVIIHGVNYKDDTAEARQWLEDFHDPYQLNISDTEGRLGLDLGVYGAPETFLIDAEGIIRYKFIGVVDERVWASELAPRYQALLDGADQ
ncbi:MAG TPA: DsbE family thiol:disulfide interchange protein [Pseudomonas xinjiangensis]|uniref:DsbE family thiol:disulfide interchange protein n=2 Tax=root TaxID=1 RepID=A0A7V1FR92_9GAMM|nr:DsbE family thiol:disulfide interchange protein [Halopseudomonas xinjiangensis]HEC47510.1 DsbE family thiol:disulfide interchange protein [Halopseudomonas xinjiangensis]